MKKSLIITAIVVLALALIVVGVRTLVLSPAVRETVVQQTVARLTASRSTDQATLIHTALGFEQPRTYLIVLANNTELRPGGGFIGSYAIVRFSNGTPEILKVEGTEILDLSADWKSFGPPPEPLKKYLGLNHWQFRDSNWSPDFRSSSEQGLVFYRQEHGVAASDIDGVIMITPTVVERVLAVLGPVTLNGVTFTSQNFTKTLEEEVEFAYEKRGLEFRDRKQMLKDLARHILPQLTTNVLTHWADYAPLAPQLLNEKHIALYSKNDFEQALIEQRNWGGVMRPTTNQDYLLWVDANLGALKTDASIQRSLSYTIVPVKGGYQATAAMTLAHRGRADKFTSRYRDYARVYVPVGSKLVKSTGFADATLASGVENGKQWFGGFVSVEIGKTKTAQVTYLLPNTVAQTIKDNRYQLIVQKQLGTLAPGLTLNLDFGKKVIGAHPGEVVGQHGDTRYTLTTDLLIDREFGVTLQ